MNTEEQVEFLKAGIAAYRSALEAERGYGNIVLNAAANDSTLAWELKAVGWGVMQDAPGKDFAGVQEGQSSVE